MGGWLGQGLRAPATNGQLAVALPPTASLLRDFCCGHRASGLQNSIVCKCEHRLGVLPGLPMEAREEVRLRAWNILELEECCAPVVGGGGCEGEGGLRPAGRSSSLFF